MLYHYGLNTVWRDGLEWHQRYSGRPSVRIKAIGEANRTGTKVHFMPDDAFLKKVSFDILSARLREIAFGARFTY